MKNLSNQAEKWRNDFPMVHRKSESGCDLVYLDSAATSQKPQIVIDTLADFYALHNANVHRGIYDLSEKATERYEKSRQTMGDFIGSDKPDWLVFTHGATESINLVAHSYFKDRLQPGDEIILTIMEHHANIVPWQVLAKEKGLTIHFVPLNQEGELDLDEYGRLLSEKTKLVAVTHVSNVLGTINPVKKITEMAHAYQAKVLIDGAQSCPQVEVDVSQIGCDFYIASAHKCYAPTGVGLLYAKPELLSTMTPYQTGGSMIETVRVSGSTFMDPPIRFEAGTPAIAEAIAWASACTYMQSINFKEAVRYKQELKDCLHKRLAELPKVKVYGTAEKKVPIAAFTHDDIHPHDMATLLNNEGVEVRAGHHCAMPLHEYLGVGATTRASLSFYNNESDIDALVQAIQKAEAIFS